jgi:hypothetical protein
VNSIYMEITSERASQLSKYDAVADAQWTAGEWAALLAHYATRRIAGDRDAIRPDARFRADMVKVAALAVACIEAIDRKRSA